MVGELVGRGRGYEVSAAGAGELVHECAWGRGVLTQTCRKRPGVGALSWCIAWYRHLRAWALGRWRARRDVRLARLRGVFGH